MAEHDTGIRIGERASLTMTITERHIAHAAELCGDVHPMHLDPGYAARTRFGQPVAHGVISLALISSVLGTRIGAPNTTVVQLGQSARFLRPVYAGDTVTAVCEVTHINAERHIAVIECACYNQRGEQVLLGEATILLDPMPFTG